jgi:hypothetical protein
MYNDTCVLANTVNFFIELFHCYVLVHFLFLPQGDGVAFLTDMCWVKDLDRALALQFHIVHELHPM